MDFFDRQNRIAGWDQAKVSKIVAACFGVGGLGSVVSLNLCRLGIGKIILFDYDVVDIHNLNRQLLYTTKDIGQAKVFAAKENLETSHNLVSKIEAHNINILENWGEVVEIVKNCNVLFNMIDYGDSFDLAAQSLCLKLQIPLVQGGTFSQCVSIDFFPLIGKPCLSCASDYNLSILEQIHPDKILALDNLAFLPKNNNPVGLSNCYLCGTCGMLMVAKYLEWLNQQNSDVVITNRTIFYVNTMESVNFNVDPNPNCIFCRDL